MNASESLKTFLKGKKQRDEETGRAADKEERIRDRRSAIEELFSKIESWLKSSVEEGIISLERDLYSHPDEQLGMLVEESLLLTVGVSEVFWLSSRFSGWRGGSDGVVGGDRRASTPFGEDAYMYTTTQGKAATPTTRCSTEVHRAYYDAPPQIARSEKHPRAPRVV